MSARGDQIVASLRPLLDSTNPVHRYLASKALPALHPSTGDLLIEVERRLQFEHDRHIATYLMNLLAQLSPLTPEQIDQVLQGLASLPQWAVLTESHSADQPLGPADHGGVAICLMAQLAAAHGTPYFYETVSAWLAQPVDNPNRAAWTIGQLRGLLNPAEPDARPAQDRAFGLINLSVSQLLEDCSTRSNQQHMRNPNGPRTRSRSQKHHATLVLRERRLRSGRSIAN